MRKSLYENWKKEEVPYRNGTALKKRKQEEPRKKRVISLKEIEQKIKQIAM